MNDRESFFISYTKADEDRATWIAEILEKEKHTVIIQAWDFRPGDNFVAKINESLKNCDKLILVLSENYLRSKWCEAEWTAKFSEQIHLNESKIIPIRIDSVVPKGLLSSLVYIDIVDKSENEARELILDGIKNHALRISNGFQYYHNIEHQQIDIDYYVDESNITYIKTCTSKVIQGGRNTIHNRLSWFPDETVSLVPLPDQIKIEQLSQHDTYLNYNVVFDHILENDEVVEFTVKAVLSNKNHHFDNFFSSEIIAPVKRLSVHLHISDERVKEVSTQEIASSIMNYRTRPAEKHKYRNPFHWTIEEPKVHYEYKIFWEIPE